MLLSIIESEFIFSNYVSFSSVCNSSASPSPHFSVICIKMHCCYCSVVVAQSCTTLCNSMDCCTPSHPVPHNLAEFSQVHVHCINDAIQPSHLLRASSISALNLSSIGDFSNESEIFPTSQLFSSVDQKYWHSRFSISPSNEYSGLISLKIDWFDDLAVQETLRNVL